MKATRTIASALSICLALLPGCSAMRARQELQGMQQDMQLNAVAWMAARQRLSAMCPNPPGELAPYLMLATLDKQGLKTIEKYVLAQRAAKSYTKVRGVTHGGGNDCALRLVKLSGGPSLEDWGWGWLPAYTTIVSVHEEEVRKRHEPRFYDEYIFGLSRYLADQADRGNITEQQLMTTLNEGWKHLIGQMQEHYVLLQQNVAAGEKSDAAVLNLLGTVAVGLALVASAALVSSAAASASRPTPVNCNAIRTGRGVYQIQCY